MNGILLFVGIMFLLWLGRSIFIPILIAAFLWYLMNAIASYYRKIMPHRYEKKDGVRVALQSRLWDWISKILSLATLIGVMVLFVTQIQPMIRELIAALPEIQSKLAVLGNYLSCYFDLSFTSDDLPHITNVVTSIGSSTAAMITSLGMVIVYLFFMFIEQSTFHKKFAALFPNKRQSKKVW